RRRRRAARGRPTFRRGGARVARRSRGTHGALITWRTERLRIRPSRILRQTTSVAEPKVAAMEVEIGRGKKGRRAYGFDDIAIVPSRRTRDPDDIDISWTLGPYRFELPLLAAAMDGVVSPRTAGIVGKLGGLAVLNLEGVFTRYDDAEEQLARIAGLPPEHATAEMQRIYSEPIKPELIAQRIQEIKEQGVVCAASLTPQRVRSYHEIALEAGLDIMVIQGTVISAEHVS